MVDTDAQDLGFQDESDGDHENDEDYHMESDDTSSDKGSNSDSDIYVREGPEHPKKSGKPKTAKVSSLFHPFLSLW